MRNSIEQQAECFTEAVHDSLHYEEKVFFGCPICNGVFIDTHRGWNQPHPVANEMLEHKAFVCSNECASEWLELYKTEIEEYDKNLIETNKGVKMNKPCDKCAYLDEPNNTKPSTSELCCNWKKKYLDAEEYFYEIRQERKKMEHDKRPSFLLKYSGYPEIPDHMQEAIWQYVNNYRFAGSFLYSVFAHELFDSLARADDETEKILKSYVRLIYNELPMDCHGSFEKVDDWLAKRK